MSIVLHVFYSDVVCLKDCSTVEGVALSSSDVVNSVKKSRPYWAKMSIIVITCKSFRPILYHESGGMRGKYREDVRRASRTVVLEMPVQYYHKLAL